MDIDLLSKMIKELILDKDEVTLPGVGTFVAEIVPSTFSDKGYTINPPYRRLSFRQRQNEEDTMLVDFYANSNKLDHASAERIIGDFLSEMKEILQEKKTIIFPGLGRLRATRENNFFFVADEDLDIYPSGFGLMSVSLKTHEETPEAVSAALSNLKEMMTGPAEDTEPVEIPAEVLIVDSPAEAEPIAEVEGQIEAEEAEEATEAENAEVTNAIEESTEGPTAAVTAEQEPVQEEEPTPVPEQIEAAPEPAIEPEPVPSVHRTLPKSLEEAEYYDVPEENYGQMIGKDILMVVLWTVVAALVLLILFVLVSHIAPDLIDKILYSKEELEIINY